MIEEDYTRNMNLVSGPRSICCQDMKVYMHLPKI